MREYPAFSVNIVYFDLETQKTFDEVGGRMPEHKRLMGMSIGVTYNTAANEYTIFDEARARELSKSLMNAGLVVGFNVIQFDYDVLTGVYPMFDPKEIPTLDILEDVTKTLGHRLKLDTIAKATIGSTKTADGLDAIRWWREGEILKIAEYCCYDVKVTKMIHEFGRENGQIFYTDKFGQRRACKVNW